MEKVLNKKVVKIAGIILLILIAITPSYYFFNQYKRAENRLQNPDEFAKEQAQALVKRVGLLIDLPTEEEPTIATISDKEKLKDQPFFTKAKNGDKVLIYTNARKAILYDPVANKIIDVAPVNLGSPSAAIQTTSQTPSLIQASLRLALYNGTETAGLTRRVEEDIKAKMGNAEIVVKDNAKKKDYSKTLVVDLLGNKKETAERLASFLNGQVSSLPVGEERPVVSPSDRPIDILAIIGKDYIK